MMSQLLITGQGGIVIINALIVLAWLVFSFLFWRGLRNFAVEEDRIFDLTFYATLMAFVGARAGFVLTHWEMFAGKSLLLTAAIWILPGFSWLGALVGALATLVTLSRSFKVRVGLVLDALALSLPLPIILAQAGLLLTGMVQGKATRLPWALRLGEDHVARHPVALYEMIALVLISVLVYRLNTYSRIRKWPYGLVGIWFFLFYTTAGFILEFMKESRVYWSTLSANQWILIGIFAESIGVLYVRGGGREALRPLVHRIANFFQEKGKRIHESISKRSSR